MSLVSEEVSIDKSRVNSVSEECSEDREEFFSQFDLKETELSPEQQKQVRLLLWEFNDIFSKGDYDIGNTNLTKHRINFSDDVPFKERHCRIPPALYQEVKDHLLNPKKTGIIQDSSSLRASPMVLVRKKNGELCLCVDYRQLNKRTIED